MHGIVDNIEVRVVGAPVALGSSIDSNSTRIDMGDYESVTFVAAITDCVATGVATLKIEQNDADSDSGMAAITGVTATATSAANDDLNGKALVTEVVNPTKRYVQAVRTSGTANIEYGSVVALLVPRRLPAAQGATVASAARVAN
jgi:hypothetical protein